MAKAPKEIETLTHDAAQRLNNPTAEMSSLFEQQEEMLDEAPLKLSIPRARPLAEGEVRPRDADLDPQIVWNGVRISLTKAQVAQLAEAGSIEIGDAQLVWRGKDTQDWSDLIVNVPPLYIQEKVHPKAIIDDLKRQSEKARAKKSDAPDLFADFNGLADPEARAEFYQHTMHWQNRFILGDSLQVMASLAEREALRGKVQCIYFDPPYGIKFNSNWQVSTQSRDVKDGKQADISRETEQVKAFRDTWKDGIHSYLTYLRDRLTVARELLTESGSIFVQIGDENVHRVRGVMDEVFGAENFVSQVTFRKGMTLASSHIANNSDFVVWFAKRRDAAKIRSVFESRDWQTDVSYSNGDPFEGIPAVASGDASKEVTAVTAFSTQPMHAAGVNRSSMFPISFLGRVLPAPIQGWKSNEVGVARAIKAGRLIESGKSVRYKVYFRDYPVQAISNNWVNIGAEPDKQYVVQTSQKVVQRCLLMTTDPGDLVLDPTCGSGTTATVAEQWGRRWITIDTSRVALALARTRLMSARYPYYLLADSPEGRDKEGKLTGKLPSQSPTSGDIRQGFVYERAPHITLKSIANNSRIDDIYEQWQAVLEPLRTALNEAVGFYSANRIWGYTGPGASAEDEVVGWRDWEIPRDIEAWFVSKEAEPFQKGDVPEILRLHAKWWEGRIARQKEIDASIAQAADVELLYDRPYEDKSKVRVAGPFTVESLSPHRVVTARDESLGGSLVAGEGREQPGPASVPEADFGVMVLDHLRTAGVHQQAKADTIRFNSIEPWPGQWLAAVGHYTDGDGREKRAGILIGPEFGTLTHSQINAAARETSRARFDSLIACAFNYDAQAGDLVRLGPLPILKARMNPDLHMADDLKNTGKGNLFVVFGEPDIDILGTPEGELQVRVNGVDVFDPSTGEIRSDDAKGIACWFIDTDYNEESFFVRHAYFLGANDPYGSLKTALRAEIDEDAWASLYSDTSRPFARPSTGRIAVKVINHFGDEVLKVFGV